MFCVSRNECKSDKLTTQRESKANRMETNRFYFYNLEIDTFGVAVGVVDSHSSEKSGRQQTLDERNQHVNLIFFFGSFPPLIDRFSNISIERALNLFLPLPSSAGKLPRAVKSGGEISSFPLWIRNLVISVEEHQIFIGEQ